jgi:hypothetical protein
LTQCSEEYREERGEGGEMTRLNRDTPEWHQEWEKLLELLKAWKLAPNKESTAAVIESLTKLGLVVD